MCVSDGHTLGAGSHPPHGKGPILLPLRGLNPGLPGGDAEGRIGAGALLIISRGKTKGLFRRF